LVIVAEEGDAGSFENEVKWHGVVNMIQSQHIVRMVRKPPAGAEGITRILRVGNFEGASREANQIRFPIVQFMVLLTKICFLRAKPFSEISLWYFFDCLVDGLCVLAYGNEPTYDPVGRKVQIFNREHWLNIHHGDLKTRNGPL
jgi:hypothetical protein